MMVDCKLVSIGNGLGYCPVCDPENRRAILIEARRNCRAESPVGATHFRREVEHGHGPGDQLIKIMSDAGVPHCQHCLGLAAKMDVWGPQGCTERLGEIVEDILPRAREWLSGERPWAHRLLSATMLEDAALRLAIRRKVEQAIRLANEAGHDPEPAAQRDR